MKHYLIYQIRNKLNGMIYIGQHQTENLDDGYMGSGMRIQYAINKYGVENFEKTILFECNSEEEMNQKEAEIVNEDFIARDDVYNIVPGGYGKGFIYANETKLNNKQNQCYISGNKVKSDPIYAEQFKKKIRDGIARAKIIHPEKFDNKGEKNPMFGKRHSDETKIKLSTLKLGEKNPMRSRIWIRNPKTRESKVILKTETIPIGWEKGRYKSFK